MNKAPPPRDHDDDPEWTVDDFARARPVDELHPARVVAALVRRGPGRPAGSAKERITIRVDKDVLARFREGGPGWQSRANEALRKAVGL